MFLDPTHNLLYVLQYITYQQDHFYKKGIYDLDEDSNRYDVLSKQTDYPHLINNYLSHEMLQIIISDPRMYAKGEIAGVAIESLINVFEGMY